MTERTCSRCGAEGITGACPKCLSEWENRKDAKLMTPEERLCELESWKVVEIDFDKIHRRFEELVGRPILTHELALNWEGLRQEILGLEDPPTVEKQIGRLTEEVGSDRVIVVLK